MENRHSAVKRVILRNNNTYNLKNRKNKNKKTIKIIILFKNGPQSITT